MPKKTGRTCQVGRNCDSKDTGAKKFPLAALLKAQIRLRKNLHRKL